MLKLLSKELRRIADDIDCGNTNATEDEALSLIKHINQMRKDIPMSKYQAFNYLGISRATFDNLVREGKIPKGVKQQGFNELSWYQKDLDAYKKNNKNNK